MRSLIDSYGAAAGWRKVEAPTEWWHVNYVGGFGRPNPGTDREYPVARKGSGGQLQAWFVKDLQKRLRAHGHNVKTDGDFGATTDKAVRAFQKSYGLKADGIVGQTTWKRLRSAPQLRRGMKGRRVLALARRLASLWAAERGRYYLPKEHVGSVFGGQLEAALKDFQRQFKLPVTGRLDAATAKRLAAVAKAQAEHVKQLRKRAGELRAAAKKNGWTQKKWDAYREILAILHARGLRKDPPPTSQTPPGQDADDALVDAMRSGGIVNPNLTLEEAKIADLPIALACALLEQESGGGHNVYGHDPVANPAPKGGKVTKDNYLNVYLPARKAGLGMQGVGPCQLTWYAYQDEADKIGGCWEPRWNMRVGFGHLASLIDAYGLVDGCRRYNGDGPAAVAYSASLRAKYDAWKQRLR